MFYNCDNVMNNILTIYIYPHLYFHIKPYIYLFMCVMFITHFVCCEHFCYISDFPCFLFIILRSLMLRTLFHLQNTCVLSFCVANIVSSFAFLVLSTLLLPHVMLATQYKEYFIYASDSSKSFAVSLIRIY